MKSGFSVKTTAFKVDTSQMENVVSHIFQGRKAQMAAAMFEILTPYIPYDTGALYNSTTIQYAKGTRLFELHWSVDSKKGYDYAGVQHNSPEGLPGGSWNRKRIVHPAATSFWTDKLQKSSPFFDQALYDTYVSMVEQILKKG